MSKTVTAGGRSFTLKNLSWKRYSDPGITEIAARYDRDYMGHFAADYKPRARPGSFGRQLARTVSELVDETGRPVLYAAENDFTRACARISFPGERWLRFWVRGTKPGNAIMTAVDQAGNRIFRHRATGKSRELEIAVNPGWGLADELVLAIAISGPWFGSYYTRPG